MTTVLVVLILILLFLVLPVAGATKSWRKTLAALVRSFLVVIKNVNL